MCKYFCFHFSETRHGRGDIKTHEAKQNFSQQKENINNIKMCNDLAHIKFTSERNGFHNKFGLASASDGAVEKYILCLIKCH